MSRRTTLPSPEMTEPSAGREVLIHCGGHFRHITPNIHASVWPHLQLIPFYSSSREVGAATTPTGLRETLEVNDLYNSSIPCPNENVPPLCSTATLLTGRIDTLYRR
jgi:hypothetical protein